jgi:hypothetical protein
MDNRIVVAARKMAAMSVESEPAITEIHLFPHPEELRLVELDPTAVPTGERITPFYFPPAPEDGIPFPAGVALILPEEKGRAALPPQWGAWSDAKMIYQKVTTPQQAYLDFNYRLHRNALELVKDLRFDKKHPWHRALISLYGTMLELYGSDLALIRAALDLKGSAIGVPILLRSAIEAHVDFKNLASDRDYGYHLRATELEQWIKILKAARPGQNPYLANLSREPLVGQFLPQFETELSDLKRKGYYPLGKKEKFERARLDQVYQSVYNQLCCDSHNDLRSLVTRHIELSPDQGDFEVNYYSPTTADQIMPDVDCFCSLLVDSTETIHRILDSHAMERIERLKHERAACLKNLESTENNDN